MKAARVLDLYAGVFDGQHLGADDHVICADEKTSIRARRRDHPSLPRNVNDVAAELAAEGRTVTLVCGNVLHPYPHPRIRYKFAKRLAKLGVSIIDGPGAKVTAVRRDTVLLADGRELPSTVTIWTAGSIVPDLAARSGLTTDGAGRLLADETLTSIDDDRIVAAGDHGTGGNSGRGAPVR